MKTFRLFVVGLFLTALFAVSAFAQTQTTRIAVINTLAFDDKTGITKYVNAMNTLEAEFKPSATELQTLANRLQTLQKDIQTLQDQIAAGKVPVDKNAAQAKVDEFENLKRDFTRKQEDYKAKIERRGQTLMGPVRQDISRAIQDYAKQKGYSLILDAAKLDESGFILGIGDDKVDVTKDFIAFYNARPAGATTSTSTPR
jgi:outer membrane protein